MSKLIFSVGYDIPGNSDNYIDFKSKKSLMDADIVVFSPEIPYDYERSAINDGYYRGKVCYGQNGSFQLKEDLEHWKKELKESLDSGKTVFIFLDNKDSFFVDTGERDRNGKVNLVKVSESNNYTFLPYDIGNIVSANGKHIELADDIFSDFFKKFKNNLEYRVYLEGIDSTKAVFVGKNRNRILGAQYKIDNGTLVVLPYLKYDEDKFSIYGEKKYESFWNKKGIKFGNILIDCLINIDEKLNQKKDKTPPPKWAEKDKFSTKNEKKIKQKIKKIESDIQKLEKRKVRQLLGLENEIKLKDLLYEKGKPLESAIIKALKLLGYEVDNYNDGILELDQVILSPEGKRYIGESEGKDNKAINITKYRQLIENLNADFAREKVKEKAFGILFGNAQRLIDPDKRTLDFTKKCKIGAKRDQVALIRTTDLFAVSKYLTDNNDESFRKKCRKAIYDNLGKIVKFPNIPEEKDEK